MRNAGNRNTHHDPPWELRLSRLLCFSPVVWRELKELVDDQEKDHQVDDRPELCDANEILPEALGELEISPEQDIQPEDRYTIGIDHLNRPMPSWMDPPWSRVLDHQALWEDPSLEVRRSLKKLLGRG